MLSACDVVTSPTNDNTENYETQEQVTGGVSSELQAPVMEWWQLYNPNGFDTLNAIITNPNSVAIDVSYTLVFYKNGTEVSKIEYCSNSSILPGHQDLIWIDADVPKASDVDDVKMENVFVTEATYGAIDGKYEYVGVIDGDACYDFTFESKPTLATIWFILYNDENNNKQLDQGEIVVVNFASLMEQTGRASFNTQVYSYTDCEVIFTAY